MLAYGNCNLVGYLPHDRVDTMRKSHFFASIKPGNLWSVFFILVQLSISSLAWAVELPNGISEEDWEKILAYRDHYGV